MKYKLNFFKIMIYTLVPLSVSIIYGLLIDYYSSILPSFMYLDSNIVDIKNLMFYMWQVQVTMALISISLTSLIIGKLEYKIYGLDFKSILMINSKLKLNYIEKIIYIIILPVINLWFILYGKLPCLMVIFLLNMIIIISIIIDSYTILFDSDKYKIIVENYISNKINNPNLENRNREVSLILSNIEIHNRELINNNSIEQLNENINYLINILKEINKSYIGKLPEELDNSINNCFIYLVELMCSRGNLILALKLVDKIINKNFEYSNKEYLVEELIQKLLSIMENLKMEKELRELSKYILVDLIYNINLDECDMRTITFWQYYCVDNIYKNTQLNKYVKEKVFRYQLSLITPSQFARLSENEYLIRRNTINYLIKILITNLDESYFREFFINLYKFNSLGLTLSYSVYANEVIIVVNIFIYYITKIEKLYSKQFQDYVQKFLNVKAEKDNITSKSFDGLMKILGSQVWQYYNDAIKEMNESGFEYLPSGQAKELILTRTIERYYIFYSIVFIDDFNYKEIVKDFFDSALCEKTLSYFNSSWDFKEDIKKEFNSFLELYKLEYDDIILDKTKQLYFIISRSYAELILLKQEEDSKNENIQIRCEEIKDEVYRRLGQNSCYEVVECMENLQNNTHSEPFMELDKSVLSGTITMLGISYEEWIVNVIENEIINAIKRQACIYKYKCDDTNKIERLFELIKSEKIEINTLINKKLTDNYWFISNESQENIEKLKKLEEYKYNYTLGNDGNRNSSIILSNLGENKFYISIELFQFSEINDKQIDIIIKDKFQHINGYYKVEIVNDIKALFTLDEVRQYLRFKNIGLNLKFTIKEIENEKTKFLLLNREW